MNEDLQRRIELNQEFNPKITLYGENIRNNINPLTKTNYLENFSGQDRTRIRIGMGQMGRLWDEGEIFPTLPDYLHLQIVLGTMDKTVGIYDVRESFENLVKFSENKGFDINELNTIPKLEKHLLSEQESLVESMLIDYIQEKQELAQE